MCILDTFFSGNNGATSLLPDSNDLSFKAESNDTHHDRCFKKIGSVLGHFVLLCPTRVGGASQPEYAEEARSKIPRETPFFAKIFRVEVFPVVKTVKKMNITIRKR